MDPNQPNNQGIPNNQQPAGNPQNFPAQQTYQQPGGYAQPAQPGVPPQGYAQPQAPPQAPGQPAPQNQPNSTQVSQAQKTNPNSTQNSLQIAEIRDGIVIMQDGSYRAVLMAQSINFDLMSPQEREGVESSYQGFLNSLYFPIQIVMRSRRVDLRTYMAKLQKVRTEQDNMLLGMLMDDYIQFIDFLTQSANIMDKQFYVVIPYTPSVSANLVNKANKFTSVFKKTHDVVTISEDDFSKALNEMKQRTQAALESMAQMGVQAVPLNTQELIELYYDVYNPDTATTQPLIGVRDLEAEIVTRGTGEPPNANTEEQ